MLAPRASSAFVCIRCELKLARPRLPVLPRRPAHANFSTSTRLRDADEPTQIEKPRQRPRLSEHPLGRLRKRKGKAALRETTARLGGVKTLGDDAEILVLKEVGEAPSEESVAPDIVSAAPQEAPDIFKSLQEENRPVTPNEIVKQVGGLRPKTHADPNEPHYVSQSTFVKLSRTLLQGFTGQQLSHYYSVTKGVKKNRVGKEVFDGLKQLQSKAKRPAERSDWHPGTTQIDRRLPGLDVHQRPKKKPISKHLLVDQILRDVWKLVLLEEIESPGELELSLKPWQLTLLTSGSTPTPLDRVGKERKAKLEIHWPHHVLRITADKNTAEYAANDVEEILQDTVTKRFHLAPWDPYLDNSPTDPTNIFPEKSLQAVSKMTRANAQVVGGRILMIRALNKSSAEEAERCLIRILPLKKSVSRTTDTTQRDAATDQSYLLPIVVEKASLDFQTREQKLGRWSLPIPRRPAAELESQEPTAEDINTQHASADQGSENAQAQVLEMMVKSRNSLIDGKPKKRHTGEWAIEPEVKLSAQFGQTLFPLDKVQYPGSDIGSFLPALPGLATMLTDEAFAINHRPGPPALEYTFVAAPEQQNFPKGQMYPELNVQFRHNDRTGKHFLRKLSLSFDERVHEVLLPNKAVDIRFTMYTSLCLNVPGADRKVASFMQAVMANIQSGERLMAPSLELDIPKWTIPGYAHRDQPGTRTVKYLFTGIRFRQSVAAKYHGVDVSYSTMQGGKLGRKSASMSAYFNDQTNRRSGEGKETWINEEKLRGFVKSCFGIAEKITKAAENDRPVSKLVKSRDQMSARKIRREGLQGVAEVGAEDTEGSNEMADQPDAPEIEGLSYTPRIDPKNAEGQLAQTIDEEAPSEFPAHLNAGDLQEPYLADILENSTLEVTKELSSPSHENDYDEPSELEGKQTLKLVA